jgi:YtkA-like
MRSLWVILAILVMSCSRGTTEFKPIQQQRSGDYTVTISNDTGILKMHSDHLRLEFRNAATNESANVTNVQIQASMVMPGMGPMFGNISTPKQTAPGQYELDADVGMAGQWNMVVTFDPNGRAQFALRAQ